MCMPDIGKFANHPKKIELKFTETIFGNNFSKCYVWFHLCCHPARINEVRRSDIASVSRPLVARQASPDGRSIWVLQQGSGRRGGKSVEAATYVQLRRSHFSCFQARLRSLDSYIEAHPISSADDLTVR